MSKFFAKPFGIGIGYRPQLNGIAQEHPELIGTYEVLMDKYFRTGEVVNAYILKNLAEQFPLLPHGVSASFWSTSGPSEYILRALEVLTNVIDVPYYSDHCALTRSSDRELGHLSANHANERMLDITLNNIRRMRERLGVPIVVENITYHIQFPLSELTPEEFFLRLVHADPDMGVLLDLTNLFINSQNHGYNPYEFIDRLPLDRIVHIHLAGGHKTARKWLDSHSWPVHDEVFDLLSYLLAKSAPDAIIIERDDRFNRADVIADLARVRTICLESPLAASLVR